MRTDSLQQTASAILVLVALALGGCATMNEDECRTVDWRTVGYEDGVAGYSGDRIGQHRKACAEYGVSPDLGLYQEGRDQGLHEYCRPANGYRLGANGAGYGGTCPADIEGDFLNAYESGRQLYTLESRVSDAADQLQSKRRELNRVEDDIVKKSATVVGGDSSTADRAQALVDAKQLAERAGRLKAEIAQLERDRARFEQDLESYRAANPTSG